MGEPRSCWIAKLEVAALLFLILLRAPEGLAPGFVRGDSITGAGPSRSGRQSYCFASPGGTRSGCYKRRGYIWSRTFQVWQARLLLCEPRRDSLRLLWLFANLTRRRSAIQLLRLRRIRRVAR